PIRAALRPLQREVLVPDQGAQRLPVRHLPHCLRFDYGLATLAAVWRRANPGAEGLEHWSADSGGRSAGTYGQAGHANNGRRADRRLSSDFDSTLGALIKPVHLDGYGCDGPLCGHRLHGRLRQDGEAAKLGTNGAAEVDLSIPDRIGRLDGAFYLD